MSHVWVADFIQYHRFIVGVLGFWMSLSRKYSSLVGYRLVSLYTIRTERSISSTALTIWSHPETSWTNQHASIIIYTLGLFGTSMVSFFRRVSGSEWNCHCSLWFILWVRPVGAQSDWEPNGQGTGLENFISIIIIMLFLCKCKWNKFDINTFFWHWMLTKWDDRSKTWQYFLSISAGCCLDITLACFLF